jgi:hypothetical protein
MNYAIEGPDTIKVIAMIDGLEAEARSLYAELAEIARMHQSPGVKEAVARYRDAELAAMAEELGLEITPSPET